jgi:hypothetical protein
MYICLFCGAPDRQPEKFCKECGVNWLPFEPGMNEPAAIKRYKGQIQELLFEEPDGDHTETFDSLRKRLKIDFAVHNELYNKIRSKLSMSEHLKAFRLEFDENVQDSFAGHDTRLGFRFSNLSATERFYKVALFWDDKETSDDMDFRAENDATVKPKDTIEIGSTHVFMRPGHKEIKGLEVTIESVAGEVAKFRAETFHVRVGNPEQRVSNNVTNNISGKVLSVDMAAGDAGTRADSADNKSPIWRNLSFVFVPPEEDEAHEIETVRKLASSSMQVTKAAPEPEPQPDPEPIPEPIPEPVAAAPIAVTRQPEPAQGAGASLEGMSLRDAVERMLELLLKFSSMASASSSKGVFLAMDFSLNLLEILHNETPDQEMDAIVGMVFENPAGVAKDDEEFVINFQDAASVITLSGITIVGKDGNTVVGHASYEWGQMAANEWGLYRQRFGPGSYLISFGDQSANQNFSGLRFDLRRYKGPESVDALYAEAEAVLHRIFDQATPYTAEDDDDEEDDDSDMDAESDVEDHVPAGSDADNLADLDEEDEEEYEDELDPEVEAARLLAAQRFTEREKRLGNFIKLYAFAAQQCDEAAPRSVFAARAMTPELWTAIHSGNGMTAVCMEPGQALLTPDGKLAGWNGAATALSGHGIYHMVSAGDGTYSMDGSSCFLSWEKFFFEIKADLVTRDAGPDLWLGTADKFLIRGSYCDYSGNIPQWDYFEDFAKKGLLEALASFKQSV